MGEGTETTWRQRIVVWWPVAIPAIVAPLAIAMWPPPYRAESVTVRVEALPGAAYEIGETGVIRSATGADYKGHRFEDTSLDLTVTTSGGVGGAGRLRASFSTASGPISCTAPADFDLATPSSRTVTLRCEQFVDFGDLAEISEARIV